MSIYFTDSKLGDSTRIINKNIQAFKNKCSLAQYKKMLIITARGNFLCLKYLMFEINC